MASYTDNELVTKLTAGNADAFSYLYQQYAATFYAIILKNVIKPDVAAALLEEFFSLVPQKISLYKATTQRFFIWMLHVLKTDVVLPYVGEQKGFSRAEAVEKADSLSGRRQRTLAELATFYTLSPTQIQSILRWQFLP